MAVSDESYALATELRRRLTELKTRRALSIVAGNCEDHAVYLSETSRIKGLEDAEQLISEILGDDEDIENDEQNE